MPAPMFPANAHRYDPYRTFKFQVVIGGRTVAGLSKMGALKRTTEVVKWRSAGDPSNQRVIPGGSSFEAVSLEQGLSQDRVFEEWANAVNNVAEGDAGMSLLNYRREVVINVLDLQGGTPVLTYRLRRAWVSEFQALPEFDANNMNTIAIQSIMVQHEGFVRDLGVQERVES
ncbi:phage tail protein [Roseomonas sp. M0104]|uniref:Phage tail protein n=1 Tax=Teichococcus coralli TaxID=2545983 RepID=A0A845BH23_9PROT|nr:phage tail protein [Pseudoroseomonas coralli]MXP65354.1 phage tail protein [Pseudoroseomonas coralli]